MRSSRSNTTTSCPARVSCWAAARPAGPEPIDGRAPAGVLDRALRRQLTVVERALDDRDLDLLDRHRVVVDGQHACRFARRGADPPGELREVVRRVQSLARRRPFIARDQLVPLRDQVAQRATRSGRTPHRNPCTARPGRRRRPPWAAGRSAASRAPARRRAAWGCRCGRGAESHADRGPPGAPSCLGIRSARRADVGASDRQVQRGVGDSEQGNDRRARGERVHRFRLSPPARRIRARR